MIKVVYFDDQSATDYLYIYDGGAKIQTSDKVKEKSGEIANKTSAGLFAKLSWLPFLGGEGSTEIDTSLGLKSNSLIRTTLSNTVLTDFLEKIRQDNKRILKFSDYTVKAYKNSIAYFKMFTPYLTMTKSDIVSEGITFEAAKMDEAFKSGKGYYEMVATDGKETCVFRFNIEAFRNNYGIADLTKMNLVYYGVKVGKVDISLLDISNEFNGEEATTINSAFDIEENTADKDVVDVYDIMLAGVEA
ncbi:MAG: hypothetical protein IKK59_06125 [Lachnospiraceae bacterium]|nr:hypothetical protein [Lachnospiraceae bacterium]